MQRGRCRHKRAGSCAALSAARHMPSARRRPGAASGGSAAPRVRPAQGGAEDLNPAQLVSVAMSMAAGGSAARAEARLAEGWISGVSQAAR